MKKLFLHIGMHKTGSSALQVSLHRSRELLRAYGVHYLDYQENHSAPFFSLFSSQPEKYHINRRNGIVTAGQAIAHNAKLDADLTSLLELVTAPITVISGEDLSLLQKPQLPRLQAFLTRFFDQITVVGYARAPFAFANSYAVQALRGGSPLCALRADNLAPKYQWRFQKFIDTFGADNVRLRPYHSAFLPGGCVVADFLKEMEVPDTVYPALTVNRINRQLSQTAGALLDLVNQRNLALPEGREKLQPSRAFLAAINQIDGPKFLLSRTARNEVRDHINCDATWMKRHFTGDVDTSIWDDMAAFDEAIDPQPIDPLGLQRLLADLPPA